MANLGILELMRGRPGQSVAVVRATALAAVVAAMAAPAPASAQELSEKSVKTFMEYAWSLVPTRFTKPNGEVVEVDKKKKEEVMVPAELAREIIRVGRVSAHAQVCNLLADQVMNYRSLMKREGDKKSWTPQQMIYISQLHLTTVMMLTGKIKLVEKQGDKLVVVEEGKPPTQTCTPEQAAKIKEVIAAYVKTGPHIEQVTIADPAQEGGASSAAAATAPQKK